MQQMDSSQSVTPPFFLQPCRVGGHHLASHRQDSVAFNEHQLCWQMWRLEGTDFWVHGFSG